MSVTAAEPAPARTARSPASAAGGERESPTVLTTVPRAPGDGTVAPLTGVVAGGLEAIQAEWGIDGGEVVLSGRRPFLDVTGRATFRSDGTLTGDVRMNATVHVLGLPLGTAEWTVAGWEPAAALDAPRAALRGTQVAVDLSALPPGTALTAAAGLATTLDAAVATIELPADAVPAGEPLSPRVAELFRGLLGTEVSELRVHADAQVGGAAAFVSAEDLFFAPGIYGGDSPEALRILDAAVRAALAGWLGPVGDVEAPNPNPPPPPAEAPPAASTDLVPATIPDATSSPDPALAPPVPEAGTAPEGAPAAEGDASAAPPSEPQEGEAPATPAADASPADPAANVLMPEAPTQPTPAAAARGGAVAGGAGGAARAARDLPDAGASADAAHGAVTEPAAETAARAQEALAAELGERPPPSPEIVELCERIRTAIRENRPEDEDDLLKSDPTQAAQNAGGTITGSVDGQVTEVSGTYDAMATPPSGSPATTPVAVVAPDASSPGMGVDAASAAPDPQPAEDTNLDADVAATDQRVADAGMETRVTAEIHDGPFQAQRDARGELGELAQRTPGEIQAEEQASIDSAQSDMANLQLQAVAAMRAARGRTVGEVGSEQTGATGSEEVTRDNASRLAQAKYDEAQRQVSELLTPLSRTAMAQWDAGLARLSREFHDSLDRVQRWIDDRHSGALGTLVAIGDYIGGLPDWVTDEYNRAERAFGDGVCDLLLQISSDVNAVIASARAIIQAARDDINGMFDQLAAEYPEFAAAERARFGGMLDGLATRVTDAQTSFVRDVSARAITAVNEAHATVQAKREEAGGLIGRVIAAIEEFIDDPIRAIINGLLRLVGIPPPAFWSLIAQIEQVISDIADDPENFINNLTAGVKQGFSQFFDNFGTHLIGAFWNWLFSSLRTPIPMPTAFDAMSLVTFALQLMGITWPNVREILVRHLGPEAVELLEIAWQLISTLINEGPQGLVNMIKEQLSPENIVGMIIDAAIDFIVEKLIVKAAEYIFSLLNPAGAVAQAIMLIYRVCSWIFRNAARIFAFVQAVVGGMANVIAGNIGGLAAVVERALASMLVVVIDLFMGLLGLGDLPDEVAGVIQRMQAYVLGIIDRIVGFLVTQARALLRRIGIGGEDDEENGDHHNEDDELGTTVRFSGGHESHRLWIDRSGDTAVAMVASTSGPVTAKIDEWRGMLNPAGDPRAALIASIDTAVAALNGDAEALAHAFNEAVQDPADDKEPPDDSAVEGEERSLASLLRQAFDDFGQASEAEILREIAAELPGRIPAFIADAPPALAGYLANSRYVPAGQSTAKEIWAAGVADSAAEAAATAVGSDSSAHRPLIEYFRNPIRPAQDAHTDDFWNWAQPRGPRGGFAVGVRRAYGDAYVGALKSNQPTDIDPIDEPVLTAFSRMHWRASGTTPGQLVNPPKEPTQSDPPLRTAVAGDLIGFLRSIADTGAASGYGLPRLRWAWNEHEPSRGYLSGAFRRADRGQHEWIPTDMLLEVVERAVTSTGFAPSGTRIGIQWINLFHNLRTDTHRVYFRVLTPPQYAPDATTGAQQLGDAGVGLHSGTAYNAPTGNSGVGLIGQEDFHNALRAAFRGLPLTTPNDYIQSLKWVVADRIWDGDLAGSGVPSPVWGAPLAVWFRVPGAARQAGLTLIDLSTRQQDNINVIEADFEAARAALG